MHLQEVQDHHRPICHKTHVASPGKEIILEQGHPLSIVFPENEQAPTIVFSLFGRPKSSLTRVPIFFSSSLDKECHCQYSEEELQELKAAQDSHFEISSKNEDQRRGIGLPVRAKEQRPEKSAIDGGLIHDDRIFLIISRIARNRNNGVLHQEMEFTETG